MKDLPLKEMSISKLFNIEKATYEIPIYQRNYAWEKEEISALIQDVYDAYTAKKPKYFIGTLVSFHKGEKVYEIIDGQQRLTTIKLILGELKIDMQKQNKLTYRARKKSNDTIDKIPSFDVEEKDIGIVKGYNYAKDKINELIPAETEKKAFGDYFYNNVYLIHYQVPKDVNLNHYFEIMNSRGEQLEKHEIIKARLIKELNQEEDEAKREEDKAKFNCLWESCSEMNVYIQQKLPDAEKIFSYQLCNFDKNKSFNDLPHIKKSDDIKIDDLINRVGSDGVGKEVEKIDTFQSIIDFSNFLLIVLKLTRILNDETFEPTSFILDDKELINEFDKVKNAGLLKADFVKKFGFNLLKAKFLLDNYLVHHSNGNDTEENNPWMLQRWQNDGIESSPKNLDGNSETQNKLEHLLSMFEVSFTPHQRKNYLFYCLLYLFEADISDISGYYKFVSKLADKYFYDVYLMKKTPDGVNTTKPGSFDDILLVDNKLDVESHNENLDFTDIYGDGEKKASVGIPLFIFNYLDYKLWEKYCIELRSKGFNKSNPARKAFFEALGCGDFELDFFDQFYFSRTRRSLEHFFPQAKAAKANDENGVPTEVQINCLGNYAMIGSEANSSGSSWDPIVKIHHYWDFDKIRRVSVASIKFMIMMQKCKDNLDGREREPGKEWIFKDITEHQNKMLDILFKKEG